MALCLLFIIRLKFQTMGMSQWIPVWPVTARLLTPRVSLFLEVLSPYTHPANSPLFTDNIDVIARISFLRVVRERSVSALSPWLADGHHHIHMTFSLFASLSPKCPFYTRRHSHIGLGPTLMTSL